MLEYLNITCLKEYFVDVNENNSKFQIYTQLSIFLFMIFAFIFSFLVKGAYYGRFSGNRKYFMISGRTSWILQECPCVFVSLYFLLTSNYEIFSVNFLGVLFYLIHYIHRTFVYPFIGISQEGKKYPFELTFLAFAFCYFNAYIQCNSLLNYSFYDESFAKNPIFFIGVLVFFTGMFINIISDYLLIYQRKYSTLKTEEGYVIPTGFLYTYISCPNYFGEIMEWIGFYLTFQTLSAFVFAFSTFANLFPKAFENHKWNLQKFRGSYPTNRKVIIPFII